jgi:hypothetical protein
MVPMIPVEERVGKKLPKIGKKFRRKYVLRHENPCWDECWTLKEEQNR